MGDKKKGSGRASGGSSTTKAPPADTSPSHGPDTSSTQSGTAPATRASSASSGGSPPRRHGSGNPSGPGATQAPAPVSTSPANAQRLASLLSADPSQLTASPAHNNISGLSTGGFGAGSGVSATGSAGTGTTGGTLGGFHEADEPEFVQPPRPAKPSPAQTAVLTVQSGTPSGTDQGAGASQPQQQQQQPQQHHQQHELYKASPSCRVPSTLPDCELESEPWSHRQQLADSNMPDVLQSPTRLDGSSGMPSENGIRAILASNKSPIATEGGEATGGLGSPNAPTPSSHTAATATLAPVPRSPSQSQSYSRSQSHSRTYSPHETGNTGGTGRIDKAGRLSDDESKTDLSDARNHRSAHHRRETSASRTGGNNDGAAAAAAAAAVLSHSNHSHSHSQSKSRSHGHHHHNHHDGSDRKDSRHRRQSTSRNGPPSTNSNSVSASANSSTLPSTAPTAAPTAIATASAPAATSPASPVTNQTFSLLLIGDEGCGKSALLRRFFQNTFTPTYLPTIGIDFLTSTFVQPDDASAGTPTGSSGVTAASPSASVINLLLYDTSGSKKFQSLIPNYLRECSVCLLCFDLSNLDSYRAIFDVYLPTIHNRFGDCILIAVGCKNDLTRQRVVSYEDIKVRTKELSIPYLETSARTGFNVSLLFNQIAKILPEISQQQQHKAGTPSGPGGAAAGGSGNSGAEGDCPDGQAAPPDTEADELDANESEEEAKGFGASCLSMFKCW